MQFAPGDLVRHRADGTKAEVVEKISRKYLKVKLSSGGTDGWLIDNIDLDLPGMIARERERLAADLVQAIRDGLLPEGWSVEAYRRGKETAEHRQNKVLNKVLVEPGSSFRSVVLDESSAFISGNVSSAEPAKESENPDKSHVHAVYTTFDPVSGSGAVIQSGFDGAIDPAFAPKYPLGSFVRWAGNVTKWRVMAYDHNGYHIEAAEGTFRDSWSKIPESALSSWVDLPSDPPSRVRLAEDRKEPHEIVIVSDQDGFDEVFYVDGKRCDGGLSDIGWVIDGGTCTIESIEVHLPDDLEEWPELFDPAWRKEKKIRAKSVVKQSLTPAPDPEPGYRLLSKDPPELLLKGDEWWEHDEQRWRGVVIACGVDQHPGTHYQRKIEQPKPSDSGPYIARFDASGKDVTDNPELWKDSDSCYRVPTEDDFGKMVQVRNSPKHTWVELRLIAILPPGDFRICVEHADGERSIWRYARIKTTVSPTDSQ